MDIFDTLKELSYKTFSFCGLKSILTKTEVKSLSLREKKCSSLVYFLISNFTFTIIYVFIDGGSNNVLVLRKMEYHLMPLMTATRALLQLVSRYCGLCERNDQEELAGRTSRMLLSLLLSCSYQDVHLIHNSPANFFLKKKSTNLQRRPWSKLCKDSEADYSKNGGLGNWRMRDYTQRNGIS